MNFFLSLCLARAVAQNKAALLKLGITHVLNAAHSKRGSIGNQSFYGNDVVYCGIPADDSTHFDLDVYFQPAADFIHKALKSPDGKPAHGFLFEKFCTVTLNNISQQLQRLERVTLFKNMPVFTVSLHKSLINLSSQLAPTCCSFKVTYCHNVAQFVISVFSASRNKESLTLQNLSL